MFDITVESPDKSQGRLYAYQNSWGLSTRSLGVMVMVHGDDQGLVLPPRVALQQVAIVPVGLSKGEGKNQPIYDACLKLERELVAAGIRAKADLREGYTPGWKFNDWEMRVSFLSLVLKTSVRLRSPEFILKLYDRAFLFDSSLVPGTLPTTLPFLSVDMTTTRLPCLFLTLVTLSAPTSMTFKNPCSNVPPQPTTTDSRSSPTGRTSSLPSMRRMFLSFLGVKTRNVRMKSRKSQRVRPTRERRKMPRRLQREPSRFVFRLTKRGLGHSRREKSRSVCSVVRRRGAGPCLEGVIKFCWARYVHAGFLEEGRCRESGFLNGGGGVLFCV